MTSTLPATFFLHIPGRNSASNPFSGYILVDATNTGTAWSLTPRIPNDSTHWTVQKFASDHVETIPSGFVPIVGADAAVISKRIYRVYHFQKTTPLEIQAPGGELYPVLTIPTHTSVFGSARLKQNVPLQWLVSPSLGLGIGPTPIAPASIEHIVNHVPPTPVKKATVTNKAAANNTNIKGYGDLQPYVAKQLLALAQLKKESCPIVAEEFSAGNTAVMPCGHLFMQMAIEESFKKEANKCPWCRQTGRPTYV